MAAAGAAAGYAVGLLLHLPTAGAWLGCLLAVSWRSWHKAMQLEQVKVWLRMPHATPQDDDLSPEIAEVVARADRALDELRHALAREQAQCAQLMATIEASPNGMLVLDGSDHIEWCSSLAAEQLGLDADRDRLKPVTNLVREPAFVDLLQRCGSTQAGEAVLDTRAGSHLSVLVRPCGNARKLVLTQDVTERVRSEAMRREFVANVSHEIRSPLTVLAGFVETMANLPLTEVERARVLGLMKQQADRMQALVADLLTLAKLEGSPRPGIAKWVDCAALSRMVEVQARAISRQRHQIEFQTIAGLEIAGNESELLSALNNLVLNAVRYTPEGGRIAVQWASRADGSADVTVQDNGPGIAAEHLPRLAERFYRVDGSRSRDTGGTGLGLAIVKHAVLRHGGELLIESQPGEGSRFTLHFPAPRVRSPGVEPPAMAAAA